MPSKAAPPAMAAACTTCIVYVMLVECIVYAACTTSLIASKPGPSKQM
jgi:hypothetical protein